MSRQSTNDVWGRPHTRRRHPAPPEGHQPTYLDEGQWPYANPTGRFDRAWRATCQCGWTDTTTWPAGPLEDGETPVGAGNAWRAHIGRLADA